LIRLPNTLTAAADVLAGAAIAGLDPLGSGPILAAAGSVLLYGGGVALNDVFDVEKDRALHPERVLPAGLISRGPAALLGASLLLCGAVSSLQAGGEHIGTTAGLVAAIVAYDLWPDARPQSGAFLMGLCRALNLSRGITLAPGALLGLLPLAAALGHLWLIFFVTVASGFEDRRAHPLGFRVACALLPLPYFLPCASLESLPSTTGALTLLGSFLLAGSVAGPGLCRNPQPSVVVRRAVFSLVIFDALYALAAGRHLAALVLAGLFPVIRILARAIGQRGS
jgi:4-hydroxybenzoate polyprenyltransferase